MVEGALHAQSNHGSGVHWDPIGAELHRARSHEYRQPQGHFPPMTPSNIATTPPAMSSDDVKEVVTVWRVPAELHDDAPPMLRRPWAGPAEAL